MQLWYFEAYHDGKVPDEKSLLDIYCQYILQQICQSCAKILFKLVRFACDILLHLTGDELLSLYPNPDAYKPSGFIGLCGT